MNHESEKKWDLSFDIFDIKCFLYSLNSFFFLWREKKKDFIIINFEKRKDMLCIKEGWFIR